MGNHSGSHETAISGGALGKYGRFSCSLLSLRVGIAAALLRAGGAAASSAVRGDMAWGR